MTTTATPSGHITAPASTPHPSWCGQVDCYELVDNDGAFPMHRAIYRDDNGDELFELTLADPDDSRFVVDMPSHVWDDPKAWKALSTALLDACKRVA